VEDECHAGREATALFMQLRHGAVRDPRDFSGVGRAVIFAQWVVPCFFFFSHVAGPTDAPTHDA
jgi:hypothetical protein